MQFRLYSDVHNEHVNQDWEIPTLPDESEQVLLLAGDIHEGTKYLNELPKLNERFNSVVYCAGNHEHYGSTTDYIQAAFNSRKLYSYVSKCNVTKDTTVLSTTLWSYIPEDYSYEIRFGMNDYHMTRYHDPVNGLLKTLKPAVTTLLHHLIVGDICSAIEDILDIDSNHKIVMVTHHAPSFKSINPKHEGDVFNCAYATDLEWLMLKYPQIKLWCHGHVHHNNDYMIGECRVVSNPRGYPSALNPDFKEDLVLEI